MVFRYGIYESENTDGYLSFSIKRNSKEENAPLVEIRNYHEGKRLLLRQAKKHELCQCLMGLHKLNGRCFHYQIKNCRGTAMGFEPPEDYNQRANKAKSAFGMTIDNTLVIGEGRNSDEYSLVQIEDGRYIGYGFIPKENANGSLEDVIAHIREQKDTPDTRTIIRNYLSKNKSDKVITYKKNPDRGRDF